MIVESKKTNRYILSEKQREIIYAPNIPVKNNYNKRVNVFW